MTFSNLYSAVCRGKWFVSFREVESNFLLVDKLLDHGVDNQDAEKLADREPIPLMVAATDGRSMKLKNSFSDAPQGSTAIIPVHGTMLKYGTYCSYGTMEYADLIREAADSSNISSVLCDIDSGGGAVDAIAPLVDAILYARSKGKAVVAHCDLCASAAYYAASYCNEIIASNTISAEFGSIGVMMSFPDYAKYYESAGIKMHTIYSNLSDYKNAPFEAAKKGDYASIRDEELDPLARDFQANVRKNRGNCLMLETEGLLRGRMFYAEDALKVGLIDSIGTQDYAVKRSREISSEMTIYNYINSKS
jgi:protease-4|uniref:S49 family peptidase n=1 Tax=Bacteroides eggerthii TaxID=28111 RepID=UPI00359CB480